MTTPAVWRTTLTPGDPDRNWSYVWNYDGDVDPTTFALRDSGNSDHAVVPLYLRTMSGWEIGYHVGFSIPPTLPAGVYSFRHKGATIATVTVQAATGAPVAYLTPRTGTADAIEAALVSNDVVLAPGLYQLSRTIRLTDRRKISGYGAVLAKTVGASPDYLNRMFIAADGVMFDGVHFIGDTYNGDSNAGYVMSNDFAGADVVFKNCVFEQAQLGHWAPQYGLLVQTCRFVRGSTGSLRSGLIYNCRWEGVPIFPTSAFQCEMGDRLAVLGVYMDGTDRGMNLLSGWGIVENCLFAGLHFRNIGEVDNGCEIINAEGGSTLGLSKCLFFHVRTTGCVGEFNIFDEPMNHCRWQDFACDGGREVLSGFAQQEHNYFGDFELRHGTFAMGTQAKHNTLERIVCISPVRTRANQFSFDAAVQVAYTRPAAAIMAEGDGAATNTVKDCIVQDAASDMDDFAGVTVLTPTPRA